MTKGISIGVGADTRQFSQAVSRGIVEPLEDVEKALLDAGKSGDKAGDKLVDSMRDAQRETENLSDEQKRLSDVIDRESQRGARSLKSNSAEGTSAAKRDLEELGNEARQNASETFSSFDGSAESFADGIQGTLGGIVSSLGPLGAAAGAAGALGIGLIMSAFDQAGTKNEDYKQKVADLATQLIETGKVGAPAIEYIVDQLKSLATETDDSKTSLDDLRDAADRSGSSYKDLARAYTGTADGLDDLWDAADRRQAQMQQELQAAEQAHSASADELRDMQDKIDATGRYRDYIDEARKVQSDAAEAERNYIEAGGKAMETRAAAVESFQSALDDSVSSFSDYVDSETGAFDPAAFIANMAARRDAVSNFSGNVKTIAEQFQLTDDEVQAILDQGLDFAAPLQSIIDSGMAPQYIQELRAAVGGGQEVLDGADLSSSVDVKADTGEAKDTTEAFTGEDRDTTIDVKADTKQATTDIRAAAAASYEATITAKADTGTAQSDVDRFVRRNDGRTFTITQLVKDRNGNPVT